MSNDKELLYAKTVDEAESKAKENLPDSFDTKDGESLMVTVRKKGDVLINHSGKVGTNTPNGWHFTFTYRNDDGWKLIHTQELN